MPALYHLHFHLQHLVNIRITESSAFLTTYLQQKVITHWKAINWAYCFNTAVLWPCWGREQKSRCQNRYSVMTDKWTQKNPCLKKQGEKYALRLSINNPKYLRWISRWTALHCFFVSHTCICSVLSDTDCQEDHPVSGGGTARNVKVSAYTSVPILSKYIILQNMG